MEDLKLPSFPIVSFLARHGNILAILAATLPVLAALIAVWFGFHPAWLVPGIVAGAALWLFVQSYVEVLRILADALMPR